MTSTRCGPWVVRMIDDTSRTEQIPAFDEFDAELVGEERMFVIGVNYIVPASTARWSVRRAPGASDTECKAGEQGVGIILRRRDTMFGKEIPAEAASSLRGFRACKETPDGVRALSSRT